MLEVVNELIRTLLVPQRVKAAAERVKIGDGDQAVAPLPRDRARACRSAWPRPAILKGKADGAFGPGTTAAVEPFQKAAGLQRPPASRIHAPCWRCSTAPAHEGAARPRPRRQPAAPPRPRPAHGAAGQPPAKLDLNLGGPTLQ